MKSSQQRRITGLALAPLLVLLLGPAASADGVFGESGPGVAHSTGSAAVFIRYQRPASALFGLSGFYEASYGSWTGPNRNEAIAVSRGILRPFTEHDYLSFQAGLGHVRRTTANLDTPFEILLRAACGRRIGRLDISLGLTHFSNGKKLFRNIYPPWWEHGPNLGEYFPTIQAGVTF